ncbi:MAG: TRAP transporter large permease [Spirochaetales bacterium]|nr:TRAP transporter large permease [Spirochaetales bacterium]
MTGVLIILLFLILTVFGLPIAFGMGISALVYFLGSPQFPISILAHRLPNALNSFPLVAVPIFIFAGNLMNTAGITGRLFKFARMLVGHRKGGLAHVNILASLIFSGISGAALADIGGLGNIEIKAMKDQGYDASDAAAITVASATIGPIFPPSIPLIIFATVAEVSAVKLLIAGIIPALLMTILLIIVVTIIAHVKDYPSDTERYSFKQIRNNLFSAFPALITPVLLVGGLLSGWFSPTEIASVTVAYSLFLGLVVYKELNPRKIFAIALESIRSSAVVLFVIGCASVFAWALTVEQVPVTMANFLTNLSQNPVVLLLLVNVLLLIIGMIMDTIAAILVITPIIYPCLMMAGVDPVHLGIVVVLNLMIGMLTPPVGMSLFMVSNVAGEPVEKVIKKVLPYFIPLLISLLLVTLIPSLSTFLPSLL